MIKKFLIGTFALALMLSVGALTADAFSGATLKQGSSGADVIELQTLVGATPDGAFGPMTKAKVMAWQASNGLTADGVFGPMSMAKANAGTPGVVYAPGCSAGTAYSSTTGQSCAVVTTGLPAGCTSTVGYSATTGAKCDGAVVVGTENGPLVGGAGDILVTDTSTDVETQVTEGSSNVKVLGFKVEASDSDVAVTNLKVSLKNLDTASSYRLDRYADTVSVYMGSTKVGSASVSDFTKDGTTYSKGIALSNAVVREGSSNKKTFYVTITANDSIDSVNMTTDDWAIEATNIRFQDATGVIMTDNTVVGDITASAFDFTSLASSGDVKVTVSKGSSNPLAQTIEVSDTASTKDVLMLEFKVKATGSDISFDTLNIEDLEGTTSTLADVVGELQLRQGTDVLATIDGSDLTGTDQFVLDDTYTVDADSTDTFRIYATINDSDNFTITSVVTGNLKVSLDTTTATSIFSPEDSNGDVIPYTGSGVGEIQTFMVSGAQVTYVSDSFTAEITGTTNPADGTIGLKFKVTAFGDNDIVINEDATGLTSILTGATTPGDKLVTSTDLVADGSGDFTVSAGDSATFTLSQKFTGTNGFVQLELTHVGTTVLTNIKTAAH